VVFQTGAAYVRRDRISNLYSVNLEVCESVESRLRKGKMLQRVRVPLLETVRRCLV
jgi:hypothetical protein